MASSGESLTSAKTTEAAWARQPDPRHKLPNPPAVTVGDVSVEDILVPAISALSTLTLLLALASAAIVLVQTWNGFCEGRDGPDGGGDGVSYLDDDDRRALTHISLRYCTK